MSFGRIAHGRLVSFGRIACKWLFCLCRIVWKNITERGRGGAYVPARVALQGRIHHYPAHNACVFGMETPLRGRSGGHTGAAPTISFGQIACGRLVSFEKEIWPSTIFSCFDFPSTGKHDFAAPRNRLNHAPFGLEDGIDGREKHRKNGDIDAQHHQLIPKNGMQEGQNTRRKMPGNAIQRRPGDG